jgi:hypothetical protein
MISQLGTWHELHFDLQSARHGRTCEQQLIGNRQRPQVPQEPAVEVLQPVAFIHDQELPAHFAIYCFTFMLYAAAMSGLGPYIPYLADTTGHKET